MTLLREKENWVVQIPYQQALNDELFTELRFNLLAQKWYDETRFLSFASQREASPTYQTIMAMGSVILPYIFRELEMGETVWFGALRQLTQANPVLPEHKGKHELVKQDWLQWAKARQLDNSFWTSKLGVSYDVQHSLPAIEGGMYGNVCAFLKKIK